MNEIRDKRINLQITQAVLAELLQVDRSTVAKWETGKAMPRADKLLPLAQLLKCSVDDLLQKNHFKAKDAR